MSETSIVQYEQRRLLNIEAAAQLLTEASSIEEVAEVRNYAEAVRLVARQAKAGLEVQNRAAEVKLRAERRAGEMLKAIEKHNGTEDPSSYAMRRVPPKLKDIGVTENQSSNWQRIASIPEPVFERHLEATKARQQELTTAGTVRLAKQLERDEQRETFIQNGAPEQTDRYQLHCGDMRDIMQTLPPVDLIITDPPYPYEYLQLYEELADRSRNTLKPDGSLLVMCGQSYLPEIMERMCGYLHYHWTLAYLTPGGQAVQLWQREVNTFWKPILWFTNGEYAGKWIGDVVKSAVNDNDKNHHHWGQSISGMTDLISRFAQPGMTILDPFCGAGTTGVAALRQGCSFIGIDVDPENIAISKGRLLNA